MQNCSMGVKWGRIGRRVHQRGKLINSPTAQTNLVHKQQTSTLPTIKPNSTHNTTKTPNTQTPTQKTKTKTKN
jgi:hypothetical protein